MLGFVEFALGLVGLWIGTDLAVRGASDLGRRYGLSETFLGLSIFAIGTDAPELMVALAGGAQNLRGAEASGLVVGNALGSVMAQGALVLGVVALLSSLESSGKRVVRDCIALLLSVALLALLGSDGEVDRRDGAVLLVVYAVYYTTLIQGERLLIQRSRVDAPLSKLLRDSVMIAGGLVIVIASAAVVIQGGLEISEIYGLNQGVIGVFGIGIGTSLPELVLAVGAVARRRPGLAIGNLVGSNVFDILVAVGAGALVHPLTVDAATRWLDLPAVALVAGAGFWVLANDGGRHVRDGWLMLGLYTAYAVVRTAANGFW